ncbi:hypothetical protein N7471_002598 [Penicillium samsonianum]|uniref:uncharacterized protein n=1 Tax=Penicillium samsonianum TaxID=1882272 RepID=UPI002547FCC1|nr:uncharacterized protein N7471_002598 [Penicillium samsonianum]KAJ6143145.1 hypothetical protein N7471_002598 [Penicillium samsonianum]
MATMHPTSNHLSDELRAFFDTLDEPCHEERIVAADIEQSAEEQRLGGKFPKIATVVISYGLYR